MTASPVANRDLGKRYFFPSSHEEPAAQYEQYAAAIRWPNGVACPRMACGSGSVAYLKNAHRWYCNECKRKFTAKVNSIFEDSPISFSKWLPAIWMLANDRNGISSCQLARALGVTQKSAWFMLHRIRRAIEMGSIEILSGEVESDETYVGPKQRGGLRPGGHHGRKSRGPAYGKQIVQGIVERKGEVRAFVVPNVKRGTLVENIRKHVQPGSTIYTDALKSYDKLNDEFRIMLSTMQLNTFAATFTRTTSKHFGRCSNAP